LCDVLNSYVKWKWQFECSKMHIMIWEMNAYQLRNARTNDKSKMQNEKNSICKLCDAQTFAFVYRIVCKSQTQRNEMMWSKCNLFHSIHLMNSST
jgi:hypothetical protein